jgi:hypothetical protein
MPRNRPPPRPVRRRSLKLAIWSLVVTLLIVAYKMLPYIESP